MRLKKLMSLVLACVFALSLVTVANAASEVYYYEDFSSYVDSGETTAAQSFVNSVPKFSASSEITSGGIYNVRSDTYVLNAGDADFHTRFVTNGAGKRALMPGTGASANSYNLHFVPATAWDYKANPTKTLVVAYDLDFDFLSRTNNNDDMTSLLLANTGESISLNMRLYGVTYVAGANGQSDATATIQATTRATNNSYSGQGKRTGVAQGGTYSLAAGITEYAGDDTLKMKKIFALDGMPLINNATEPTINTGAYNNTFSTQTEIRGISIGGRSGLNYKLANIRMYTIDNDGFAVAATQTTDVPLTTETIRFKFTNPVSEKVYASAVAATPIVVKKDGEVMNSGYTVGNLNTVIGAAKTAQAAGGEAYSYVDISFDELEEDTTYTVEFPAAITNEIAQALTTNVATFKTKAPELASNFTVVKNWGTANETVADSFTAEATLQGGKLEITNNTDADKDVAVIYAVYSHNGQLKDVVYVNDKLAQKSTSEIEAGVTLSEDLTEGSSKGYVKAFIWNTIEALTPYLGAETVTINAAE